MKMVKLMRWAPATEQPLHTNERPLNHEAIEKLKKAGHDLEVNRNAVKTQNNYRLLQSLAVNSIGGIGGAVVETRQQHHGMTLWPK